MKYTCVPCASTDLTTCPQHLFLGVSIQNFDVSLGWNSTQSVLRVSLKEDTCVGEKICYSPCLESQTIVSKDPGFYGLPRYERADTSQYSSSIKENPGDVLIRADVQLVGSPVFFRVCEFEWCGIVQSWSHSKSVTGGNTYYVELVDPRIVLDKASLIIGEYGGFVNQFGTTGCPATNLFNIYAYAEQFGLPCLPFVQCTTPGSCAAGVYSVAGTCSSIDGTVFGSPNAAFGGSGWTESGMTIGNILTGLNLLINSIPSNANIELFSPYSRLAYCSQDISAVGASGCGLMQSEVSGDPCVNNKHLYYFDFTELLNFVPTSYRMGGPVIAVGEMINQLSTTFGFDYYVDLVPFQAGLFATCIDKVIKLRCVDRNVAPNVGQITQFIESNLDCVGEYTTGIELRSENSGKYLIGGFKETVYQAFQHENPDANFLGISSDTNTMVCLNSFTGLAQAITYTPRETLESTVTNPCKPYLEKGDIDPSGTAPSGLTDSGFVSEESVTLISDFVTIPGYPKVDGATLCSEIDDIIVPFFGEDADGNYLVLCKDDEGNWFFDAPTWELQSQLLILNTGGSTIRISEKEMRASLGGFDSWHTFIDSFPTETSNLVPANEKSSSNIDLLLQAAANSNVQLPRDAVNPHITKFKASNDNKGSRIKKDVQSIYDWVNRYATEFYGKKFAVRVPFSCCVQDADTLKIRRSDIPNNNGGWTEQPCVLGLPNNPFGFGSFEFLNFFRTEDGKIRPFVRFEKGVLKEVSGLGKDDYFYFYNIPPASLSAFDTGNGPPSGTPTTSSAYIDLLNGSIYSYNHNEMLWTLLNSACVLSDSGSPPISEIRLDCLGLYVDIDTCDVYISTDPAPSEVDGTWDVSGDSWKLIDIYLYVRAEIREDFTFYDKSTCCCPRVVVELPQAITLREKTMDIFSGIAEMFTARASGCSISLTDEQIVSNLTGGVAGSDAWLKIYNRACMPEAVAFPMTSNTVTYGPWTEPSLDGGNIEVAQDPAFVPWNFGSYAAMDTAANLLVQYARTDLKIGEIGNICVPGVPSIPLGAELGALGGGFYGGGTHLIESRSLTQSSGTNPSGGSTNYGSYQLSPWGGVYGPNISNISVNFNCSAGESVKTCYSMRTFSPPRRDGVGRWLVDQLRLSRGRLDHQVKYIRSLIEKVKRERLSRSLAARDQDKRRTMQGGIPNSEAAEILVAEIKKASGNKTGRTNIATITAKHASQEMQSNFSNKAFMSMDGFYRPISMDGNGDLPNYSKYKLYQDNLDSSGNFDASGFKSALNNGTKIKQDDLNFLTNPTNTAVSGTVLKRNWVSSQRSDTPSIGHDIDIVGRDGLLNGTPHAGLIMPNNVDSSGNPVRDYTDDYRALTIRGPVWITSWGYDSNDRPIPNKQDTYVNASNGIYKDVDADGSGLDDDKFLDKHLQKPETWVTAPLDIRYNRDRGVWEAWSCNNPCITIAKEDFNQHTLGKICEATLPSLSGTINFLPTNILHSNVMNLSGPVWSGCVCTVESVKVGGVGSVKSVIATNSAQRIRGSVTQFMSPGDTELVNGITPIDGCYPYSSVNVYLPTNFVSVDVSGVVWAEWNVGAGRFEAYSADCQVSG